MNTLEFLIVFMAFAVGGVLKGATGAGAPILVVPLLTMYNGVVFAVIAFVIPNLISNLVQIYKFFKHVQSWKFVALFTGAGAVGAAAGTLMLTSLHSDALMSMMATAVFMYIGFRLFNPNWKLELQHATRFALPAGTVAGILQGAAGVSAPVSITFLNAMKLEREHFIATISIFFFSMGVVQFILLTAMGQYDRHMFIYSLLAVIPLMAGMPIGSKLIQYVPRDMFDKIILALLFVLASKLIFDVLSG